MSNEKLILDIRYFESDKENTNGNSLPSKIGNIYDLPVNISALGSRIARKLREYNFKTGEYDHVYINFTSILDDGEINVSSRAVEKWMKYIDIGLNPASINNENDKNKSLKIEEFTFKALSLISNNSQTDVIRKVEKDLSKYGTELEILHKYKETKSYKLKLTYQICPNNKSSLAKVYYSDLKNNMTFESSIDLMFYEDIFSLASNISVSKGNIVFKPRASYKAEVYNERYNVPINIPIKKNA